MISIVVVNWNSGPLLESCVASVLKNSPGSELVVVDNASQDRSADFLSTMAAGPILLRNKENLGFAAANNIGWKSAKGDPVLLLNPDAECLAGSIPVLEQTIRSDPSLWACAGRLVAPASAGRAETGARRLPTVSSAAAELLLLDEIWPANPWSRRYRMRGEDLSQACEVQQPPAACLMLRRSALESIGGFDERFRPAWFEDVDLCKRVRDAGGRILYQPSARFLHHGGYSLGRLPYGRFLEHYHSNQIRYFAKHHGDRAAARIRTLAVVGLRLRGILSLFYPLARDLSRLQSSRAFMTAARYLATLNEGLT